MLPTDKAATLEKDRGGGIKMHRRIFVVVALAALLVAIVAPAALAVNQRCEAVFCNGTSSKDNLSERQGNRVADNIRGRQGDDIIGANLYSGDRDVLYGSQGDDKLRAKDGDNRDKLNGGPGRRDRCDGDFGDQFSGCETQVEGD
jgi:hypothetical protein